MTTRSGPLPIDGGNAPHLRRLNLERLLAVVMDHDSTFTRAELIQATGLSAPTVGSLVTDLIRSGVVRDLGAGPSRGGRRPSFMEFNARHGSVVGIDLGPTRTRLAVADLRGEPIVHDVISTPAGVPPEMLVSRLAAAVRRLMRKAEVAPDSLAAVAAGVPGAVDWEKGVVTFAPNLGGWANVPMREILERTLGVPTLVENDVNLAILGERWRGAAQGHQTCAYITVGTGIGAGMVVEGILHRGHHSTAGEIAFMCMGPQYLDAKAHRCLERLASLKALGARWPPAAGREPGEWVPELMKGAGNGDGEAAQALQEAARFIGIAVANLAVVIDPSLVVMGGALMAEGDPLLPQVRRVVEQIVPAPPEIAMSALGKEAPLWGSLMVAATEARRQLRLRLRQARRVG